MNELDEVWRCIISVLLQLRTREFEVSQLCMSVMQLFIVLISVMGSVGLGCNGIDLLEVVDCMESRR